MKLSFPLRTFSLRSLIVLVTLCGIGLAVFVSPSVKQWRMLRRCERALLADGIDWSPTVDPKGRYSLNIDGSKLSLESAVTIAASTPIKSVCLSPIPNNDRLTALSEGFAIRTRLGEVSLMQRLEMDKDWVPGEDGETDDDQEMDGCQESAPTVTVSLEDDLEAESSTEKP